MVFAARWCLGVLLREFGFDHTPSFHEAMGLCLFVVLLSGPHAGAGRDFTPDSMITLALAQVMYSAVFTVLFWIWRRR
jgi:hypothetical protein